MKCEVQRVRNNPRFRILKIEGNTYIIDLSQSILKIIFPFLTWIAPNTIYKVDEEDINKLQLLGNDKSKNTISILLTAGVGIFLGNLLTGLTGYLELRSTLMFNVALSGVMIILLFGLRSYFSNKNKHKLYTAISLDKTLQERILIRPKSFKHFIQCFFYYVFSLGVSLLFFLVYIQEGNLVPLIVATTFLLPMLVANAMTVLEGSTKVKFKKN